MVFVAWKELNVDAEGAEVAQKTQKRKGRAKGKLNLDD
jgi:hypothetical protein